MSTKAKKDTPKQSAKEAPIKVYVDSQHRLHCNTGPFCIWSDGTKLYSVHGVQVPEWIIEEKHKINLKNIMEEANAEVRQVMINFYGIDKYLLDSDYEVLDEDKDQFGRPRRLLRCLSNIENTDKYIVRVEVLNSTAELVAPSDTKGMWKETVSGKDYYYSKCYLPVHPELKPIKNGALIANAREQKMTCHNAVASTFGLYGEEYGIPGQIRQGDVFIKLFDLKGKPQTFKFAES